MYRYLKVAASIAAILLLASIITFQFFNQNNTSIPVVEVTTSPSEGIQKVELEDGSIVYLNQNATLTYPEKFHANKRAVTLQGEAFFEISKDVNRPFRILTNHSEVEVLGTSFNINTETQQTAITVATGKVKVKSLSKDDTVILTPNQSALVDNQTIKTSETQNQHYQSWKTGAFQFEKMPISQVVKDLNVYYKDKIILTKSDSDCLFSSTFNQTDLKDIVEIIQLSCNLKLNKKNEAYELY